MQALKHIKEADKSNKIQWLYKIKVTLSDMGLSHLWLDPEGNSFPSKIEFKDLYREMVWHKFFLQVNGDSLTGRFMDYKTEYRLEAYWDIITSSVRKLYHQFRVGSLPTKSFTKNWGTDSDLSCHTCPCVEETLQHILFVCPAYNAPRMKWLKPVYV